MNQSTSKGLYLIIYKVKYLTTAQMSPSEITDKKLHEEPLP